MGEGDVAMPLPLEENERDAEVFWAELAESEDDWAQAGRSMRRGTKKKRVWRNMIDSGGSPNGDRQVGQVAGLYLTDGMSAGVTRDDETIG